MSDDHCATCPVRHHADLNGCSHLDCPDNPLWKQCEGTAHYMGRLGNLGHFRCRQCGAESTRELA